MFGEQYSLHDKAIKDKRLDEIVPILIQRFTAKHKVHPLFMQIRQEDYEDGSYPVTIIRCSRNLAIGVVMLYPIPATDGKLRVAIRSRRRKPYEP